MEQEPRLTGLGLDVRVRVVIVAVDLEELFSFNEVLVLVVGHRCDALLDQLVESLNVETKGDDLLLLAHLEEGTDFHLSVLILNVSLS